MVQTSYRRSSGLLSPIAGIAIAVVVVFGLGLTPQQPPPLHVVRVEEDWSVRLYTPDTSWSSPQLVVQMQPDASLATTFCLFNINFQQLPNFLAGGLELQMWEGSNYTDVNGSSGDKLRYSNERVAWTQYMEVQPDNSLKFGVKNLSSFSFNGLNESTFYVLSSGSFDNLDNYSVDTTVQKSGVMFGAARVQRMRIRAVRKYMSDGTVQTDTTTRNVFTPAAN